MKPGGSNQRLKPPTFLECLADKWAVLLQFLLTRLSSKSWQLCSRYLVFFMRWPIAEMSSSSFVRFLLSIQGISFQNEPRIPKAFSQQETFFGSQQLQVHLKL
ncbi:hypothetical protein ACH5RR_031849 [Cinchona calisaya]|uniref:Uncharacterized protein n=1 Tax=Cinchona calisaya TaxID=153742 RepID=A0ABD2YJE9_9GENT